VLLPALSNRRAQLLRRERLDLVLHLGFAHLPRERLRIDSRGLRFAQRSLEAQDCLAVQAPAGRHSSPLQLGVHLCRNALQREIGHAASVLPFCTITVLFATPPFLRRAPVQLSVMMAPLLLPVAAAILSTSFAPACEAPFAPRAGNGVAAPSIAGLPGLFEVPAATSFADRSAALSFNSLRSANTPGATQQRNAFVSFGFLPRLTLTGRGSVMDNAENLGMRDISASAQLLLLREAGWMPSLAIGAQDFGGAASNFTNKYVVASKTLLGRARLSAGFGSSIYSLDGAFGGIEIAPCSWLTLLAENDGTRRNAGVRLAPLGEWGARKGIEPTIDLLWREGQGRMAGVGLRLQAPSPAVRATRANRPASETPKADLQSALVSHGFENVRTATIADTLAVSYENRVFNRDEFEALGIVMAEAARRAGPLTVMRITIARVGLPVMRVVSGVAAFKSFLAGSTTGESFASQLVVTHPSTDDAGPATNRSALHVDVTVRPRLEHLLLTEISVGEARLSFLPEATVHLARGISLTGRKAVVAYTTQSFPREIDEENADQLLLHLARPGLPLTPEGAITQLSIGRFGPDEVGLGLGVDAVTGGGRVSYGGFAAVFGEHPGSLRRSVALASVRLRQAPLDLAFSLTAGRFRHGDVGGVAEVERRFGLAEVAFFGQWTSFAPMAGVRVSLPLTGARDLKPGYVRIRLPEYGDLMKRTEVFDDVNNVRADVARPLETGQDLARVFRGRDRLNGVRLRREVETLRAAAIRWGVQ
jgi:hypothetical protein